MSKKNDEKTEPVADKDVVASKEQSEAEKVKAEQAAKEDRRGDIAIIMVIAFIAAIIIGHFTMKSSVESGVVKGIAPKDSVYIAPLPGVEDAHKTMKERGIK